MELPDFISYEYLKRIPQNELDMNLEEIVNDMVDDFILGECYDLHQDYKLGVFTIDVDEREAVQIYIDPKPGLDIFGSVVIHGKLKYAQAFTVTCKFCKGVVVAERFTRHLETHYTKNRASSRAASEKIKTAAVDDFEYADHGGNGANGSYSQKSSRKRQDRNSSGGNKHRNKSKINKQ